MKIITSFLLDYGTGKATDLLLESFKKNIIERWSKWRTKKFLETFYKEFSLLLNSPDTKKLNSILNSILQNEDRSEALFEAYRRVCLSRSKNIGPCIIGFITAKIISEKRAAKPSEEIIFSAAENLNDDELIEFEYFISKHGKKADIKNDEVFFDNLGNLKIRWKREVRDSNWHRNTELSISPLNLISDLGIWASKLKDLGILSDTVVEKILHYEEDSDRHIDQDGQERSITWWISINKEFFLLSELIERFAETEEKN
jgi:hypothetical protein